MWIKHIQSYSNMEYWLFSISETVCEWDGGRPVPCKPQDSPRISRALWWFISTTHPESWTMFSCPLNSNLIPSNLDNCRSLQAGRLQQEILFTYFNRLKNVRLKVRPAILFIVCTYIAVTVVSKLVTNIKV